MAKYKKRLKKRLKKRGETDVEWERLQNKAYRRQKQKLKEDY